ncbi:glycosyl hydrolase 43 family protein [Sphingomonas piscis]|uniref:Glycosyl hydrolase 43 family protein n=2 Tax=Sphingomonas piscis TaxID=2714943 RepID=A0A6G7YTN8_9SPHN|nr:glycosyl hydrolase 43 family protein [Sphingomonas piscis]
MVKAAWLASATVLAMAGLSAAQAQVWRSDQGDGTFRNPILYADYPDPDIIRVGEDFYFVSTTFANAPGVTLLHSRDLVNWKIVGHVVPRLDGSPKFDLEDGGSYRTGFFAASLRHHGGTFYIAITPVGHKTRIYRSKAITGPWTYNEIDREAFDPGLFFDDDGKAYIATSIGSDGTVTLLSLNKDLTAVTSSKVIHYVQGIEGSKLIKRKGTYYLFNALPRRLELLVSRSKSLDGPWETRPQISTSGKTGGHQGALVDLPDGRDFGFVMFDAGSIGRMTNISPVHWVDGWPVWGTPEQPGRVPDRALKPIQGQPFSEPPTTDNFAGRTLGLQWQWNHNPDNSRWSLTQRPGFLRLHATRAPDLWSARNTLVQKGQGPRARATIKASLAGIRQGDVCGLGTFGKFSPQLAISGESGGRRSLRMQVTESTVEGPKTEVRERAIAIRGGNVWLRTDLDFTSDLGRVAYSLDARRWTYVGGTFPLKFDWRTGTFQGEQIAISCYNPGAKGGFLDVDSFTLAKF